jgi:hypothetical protein
MRASVQKPHVIEGSNAMANCYQRRVLKTVVKMTPKITLEYDLDQVRGAARQTPAK